jgi:hypothetical protein
MKRSRPTILDQHGRPVAFRLFEAGNTATRREHPGAFYNATQDTRDALPRGTWAQILSSGRFLFANVPIVRGALLEQAAYSFPLVPQYTGKDKAWGQEAERWLNDWHKICNVKGPPYTQHINSRIRMLAYKVDGDIGTVLTFGTSDFPLLQQYPRPPNRRPPRKFSDPPDRTIQRETHGQWCHCQRRRPPDRFQYPGRHRSRGPHHLRVRYFPDISARLLRPVPAAFPTWWPA